MLSNIINKTGLFVLFCTGMGLTTLSKSTLIIMGLIGGSMLFVSYLLKHGGGNTFGGGNGGGGGCGGCSGGE